jgi:hypothetical protein
MCFSGVSRTILESQFVNTDSLQLVISLLEQISTEHLGSKWYLILTASINVYLDYGLENKVQPSAYRLYYEKLTFTEF